MITKDVAVSLRHGQILHHTTKKNADDTPMRVRVNGKVATWKTRPDQFSIPIKYGLKQCGYIDNYRLNNCDQWELPQHG